MSGIRRDPDIAEMKQQRFPDSDRYRQEGRIPIWDGQPHTLSRHKMDVDRWFAGEDLAATLKYILTSRNVQRQKGFVRIRAMEFEVDKFAAVQAEYGP